MTTDRAPSAIDERFDAVLADAGLPDGVRPATVDDVPAFHAAFCELDVRYVGEVQRSKQETANGIGEPNARSFAVLDGRGDVISVIEISCPAGGEFTGTRVLNTAALADARGLDLTRWCLDVAGRIDPARPVHSGCDNRNSQKIGWLESLGGVLVRRWGDMAVPLDPARLHATAPACPPGVTIRTCRDTEADHRALYDVLNTAFLDHYGVTGESYEDFVGELRRWVDDWELYWLASVDGEPAAALLGYLRPTSGYIGTLGTLRAFRKRGLGRLLLLTSFAEFGRRGLPKAALGVDLSNPTGAVRLYESVGMTVVTTGLSYEWPALTAQGLTSIR